MDIHKIKNHAVHKLICCISVLAFLAFIFDGLSATFNSDRNNYSKRVEINLKNECSGSGELLKLSDITRVKQKLTGSTLSCISEVNSQIQANDKLYQVNACLTDNIFTLFSDISIIKGAFFNKTSSENGLNTAVISCSMAEKLFGTHDVIGNEIEILNEKYKVTGLYENNRSIVSFFSSDGIERVYLPYKSYSLFRDLPVKTVFFRCSGIENKGFRENYIKELFNIGSREYKINDFYETSDVVTQLEAVLLFMVGLWCVLVIIRRLAGFYRQYLMYLKGRIKEIYLKDLLIKEKGTLTRVFFVTLCTIAITVAIILLGRCKVNIPPEYIPYDNIFDFEFYFEKFKEYINNANSAAGYIPTYTETFFNNTAKFKLIVLALLIAAFLSAVSCIRLLKHLNCGKKTIIKVLTIPAFITSLFAVMLLFLSGMEIGLPLKTVGMLYFLFFLKIAVPHTQPDNFKS